MAAPSSAKLMQCVNGEGLYQTHSVEQFVGDNKLSELRQNYQIVAIMGPQSSGKSTLLNHLVRAAGWEKGAESRQPV